MKTKSILISIAIVITASSFGGCMNLNHSDGSDVVRNATQDSIKQKIIVGKSTKVDVTRELGAPEDVINDPNNGSVEQWVYHATDTKGSPVAGVPIVGWIKHDFTATVHLLYVFFNKRGIVSNVEFSSSSRKGQTGFL